MYNSQHTRTAAGERPVRRPQVAKHPFSRTAAQAAAEDGVDTSVVVTLARVKADEPAR